MKIVATAGELAAALVLAATLGSEKEAKVIPGLAATRLIADGAVVTVAANVGDYAIALSASATVVEAGEVALPGARLAALIAGFAKDDLVEITTDDTVARISCERSHFRLPTIAPDLLPLPLALGEEIGKVELAREEAVRLLVRPRFAAADDRRRYYLNGILLHDIDGALAAVATDGHRLCRVIIPGAAGLSTDRRLIVAVKAAKVLAKLLGNRTNERIVLRRGRTLLAVEAASFIFICKLVDAEYPTYERVLPAAPVAIATVARDDLKRALARLAAAATPVDVGSPLAGLAWSDGSPLRLNLPRENGAAEDSIEAQACGGGRIALTINYLAEVADELTGERVRLEFTGANAALKITDPDDADLLTLQMPCLVPPGPQ
jgi:DNA polymerase-3 subunit beta